MSSDAEQATADCTACRRAALVALAWCEKHAQQLELVPLFLDCVDACEAAMTFIARGSEHAALYCGACSEICEHVADKLASARGRELASCAAACRVCALSCNRLSSVHSLGGAMPSRQTLT
jgi:hypothetical protein